MSAAALLQLLPDFGPIKERSNPAPADAPRPTASAPQADIGRLIAEAVSEAEAALKARLTEAHQKELAEIRQANADEAKAFLETLGADVGATIAARMDGMQARMAGLVSTTAARIIGGLLSEHLQKRSLEALTETIKNAMKDDEAIRVRVQGPASLFETLSASLGERAADLVFTEAPGFDLTVTVDDVVVETRMSEWSTALSEILS
ncbi:hypothetical protein ASD64_05945 [Mesorhizobium sp. Root157]|uniref:hypothetical protein n=1 Tax=Mesorhizobium sp. Root157 TaxID=1736477 RepID=UPI0007000F30|nr:hypothetical protein [Mesorhizobium sp. Root157]KQZ87001.1 hypothetical protein ASD64_05945 [Mesorhizobium sp. Root157]